jgi:hypothetical protein
MDIKNLSASVLFKRVIFYCLGLFVMALGVAFSVKSNIGVSPVNSLPYVLSAMTPIAMGNWVTIVFCCYIGIQALILRKEFELYRLLQILCSFLFGWFVNISNALANAFLPDPANYLIRLVYLVISMALVGLGIFLYLGPHLLSLPGEGVMQVISEKSGVALHIVKIIFDTTVSLLALILSLIYFHTFNGVREGTVFAAIGVGKFLGLYAKYFRTKYSNFIELDESGKADAMPMDPVPSSN